MKLGRYKGSGNWKNTGKSGATDLLIARFVYDFFCPQKVEKNIWFDRAF